jgi:pyroglutamyl-peptidase
MFRILITAFEPYGEWSENASWLALVELTRNLPEQPQVTTRRYPVDFDVVRRRLGEDLRENYDLALHLGQAPGRGAIELEAIAVNIRGGDHGEPSTGRVLCEDGPVAFRSDLPLDRWAELLRDDGIPARVSHHAGTYLCNATLYWSLYLAEQLGLKTRATFVHLPLAVSQVAKTISQPGNSHLASMPPGVSAQGIRRIIDEGQLA